MITEGMAIHLYEILYFPTLDINKITWAVNLLASVLNKSVAHAGKSQLAFLSGKATRTQSFWGTWYVSSQWNTNQIWQGHTRCAWDSQWIWRLGTWQPNLHFFSTNTEFSEWWIQDKMSPFMLKSLDPLAKHPNTLTNVQVLIFNCI